MMDLLYKHQADVWPQLLLPSILIAEAEAMRDGVRLVPEGCREGVILETDSQELQSLWRSRIGGRSEVAAILHDV
jgi:hypothetical protein